MSTEWYELESDPGLFTLLMRDFGVKGVEVEEIYDLGQEIEGSVYGFIFLANWTDDGNWRRRNAGRDVCSESGTFVEEAETVNNMFFAHQVRFVELKFCSSPVMYISIAVLTILWFSRW
jgi:ubiquitin carboxyl-terminal hydrolase BAP1